MLLLTLIFAANLNVDRLDLDALGFYHQSTNLYSVDAHILIVGRVEHLLVMIDAEGREIGRYDQEGLGPNELHYPKYLGHVDGTLWFVTNRRHLIAFDRQLKIVPHNLPPLPLYAGSGKMFEGNTLVITPNAPHGHLLAHLKLQQGTWQTVARFPFDFMTHKHDSPFFVIQGSGGYRMEKPNLKDDHYQFDFFQSMGQEEPSMGLIAPIDSLQDKGLRVFANRPVMNKQHHIVSVSQYTWPQMQQQTRFYDFFDLQGQWITRLPRPNLEAKLVVLGDGSQLFELEFDTMILTRFEPSLL